MSLETAVNILNMIEWALLNNSLQKLDFSLSEIYEANEICSDNRFRTFTKERICELYIIMKTPLRDITRELSDTTKLFNN